MPTAIKVELIERWRRRAFQSVEAGSFVSPRWVPQMADTAEVLARHQAPARECAIRCWCRICKGLRRGGGGRGRRNRRLRSRLREPSRKRNINCSIAESLERFRPVMEAAVERDLPVRGYVSCVLGCPYEGDVAPDAVARVARALADLGCYEVSLGDTIGVGTPRRHPGDDRAGRRRRAGRERSPSISTTPTARRSPISWRPGVRASPSWISRWPGSAAVPMRRAPAGNVASEDVLYMLEGLGIETRRRSRRLGRRGTVHFAGALGAAGLKSKAAVALVARRASGRSRRDAASRQAGSRHRQRPAFAGGAEEASCGESRRRPRADPRIRHPQSAEARRARSSPAARIYWVIKGFIRVRQRILALDPTVDREGRRACAIRFDPELVATAAVAYRPIQGWRYLEKTEAPPDLAADDDFDDMPPEMRSELRSLGLI